MRPMEHILSTSIQVIADGSVFSTILDHTYANAQVIPDQQ